MKTTRSRRWALAAAVTGLAGWCSASQAQLGPGTGPGPGGPQAGQASVIPVYANPALNPYLSPYASPFQTGNPDFLLYMYAANQRNGGIGSGVISGTRPAPGMPAGSRPSAAGPGQESPRYAPGSPAKARGLRGAAGSKTSRPASEMPMSVMSPGASASGYFQRGMQSNDGLGRFYNRPVARFQSNGR